MAAPVFVATSAPPGWELGQWSQKSDTIWEEKKLSSPSTSYQFEVITGPSVPGSATVRLRMSGTKTEALLLEQTVQIFVDGQYFGEYLGSWADGAQETSRSAQDRKAPPAPVAPRRPSGPPAVPEQQKAAPRPPQSTLKAAPPATPASPAPAAAPVAARPQKAANLDRSTAMATKLLQATLSGDVTGVKRLLESGVDPDVTGIDGTTPLFAAASNGHLPIVEALLAAGADVNLGKDGNTPMTVAFQRGHKEVLQALFKTAFQSLETAVGPGAVAGRNLKMMVAADDDEVPESALYELREVTAKLAELGKTRGGGGPGDFDEVPPSADSDKMREDAVRGAMMTIARATD